ncbi:MAG TPA: hypothetical protein VJQ84_03955 [Solirubrobacterales bacterium]|nr:hypothetical protein [Solirubrobacterales bacterium]
MPIIAVDEFEAVTVMTVRDVLEVGVPARNFLPKTKLNPLEQREVDKLRELHTVIQRDFAGAKKTNAKGPLADYIRDQWLPDGKGPRSGFIGVFILCFPQALPIEDGLATIQHKGIFLDGESRGDGLLTNVERLSETEVEALLEKRVAVLVVHGIQDPKVVAKYFADVNGKGVGVNPNLVAMADYTDPYGEVTKAVFEKLGYELETRQRQVAASSEALMTGLQARLMIAAMAKGVGVIQYGAKPIPTEKVDMERLEKVALTWLEQVFDRFGWEEYRSKANILRSVPVTVSLGALGRAFYDADPVGQERALAVLSDAEIDWSVGKHWSGVAGKVNPATERFAVGGAKEYAHATIKALTEADSDAGEQIRGAKEPAASLA